MTALETPCREYQGTRNAKGYGVRFGQPVRDWGSRYVHRQIWAMVNGPIPQGMNVMHLCDNPPCFRYDHLFLGTPADNSADMVAKGRATQHGIVTLPETEIVEQYRLGWSLRRIAAALGCTSEGVRAVLIRHGEPRRTNHDRRPRW